MPFRRIKRVLRRFAELPYRINRLQEAVGRIERRQTAANDKDSDGREFRVFSQWGEDGIIQHLIRNIPIERKLFVEFGVENYAEANTRFLLTNNYWSGLVIDGSASNIEYIKRDSIYWACNLKAEHSFVTRENINDILASAGISGDIGLLSIDIDGNDYWVWEAINAISPRIVICEYNSHFGPAARVSTPYDPKFIREDAHFSKIYYGASISALNELAESRNYSLVAANDAGNNVFFVRNDVRGSLAVLSCADAYRRAAFREYHDEEGRLTYDDFETRLQKIGQLPVYDFSSKGVHRIADVVDAVPRSHPGAS
jgi:hypothetical protein